LQDLGLDRTDHLGADVARADGVERDGFGRQLVRQRTAGTAVLLVSADLSEVMSLSDRIIAMFEGKITGVFPDASQVSEEELGLYMLGLKHQTPEEMELYL
ncbi:MAG: hypothetical protein ROW39_02015, partial [Anaerolineaceae bacterium]